MGLKGYLIKRVVIAVLILWIVITLNFYIFILHPGDPTHYMMSPGMTEEQKQLIRDAFGVDEPIPIQYVKYIKNLMSFGLVPPYFGFSHQTHEYVADEMSLRLPFTLLLLGSAELGAIIIGVSIGMLVASRRGTKIDISVMGVGLFTYALPTFFIEIFALYFFVSYIHQITGTYLFPSTSWMSYPHPEGFLPQLADIAWHLTLPVACLIIISFAYWALYTRNMLLDVLTQDYILTARAKGLGERAVLFKHALKSIYPQLATMIALTVPSMVTGAIITETVFGLEGIGKWYIDSISIAHPDYPVVEAILFIYAALTIFFNLLADVLYGVLDPRIRVGARK
jgi:peptide/nickel transport system permease protein